MSKEEQGKQGFKVTDRRGFTSEGQPRERSEEEASSQASGHGERADSAASAQGRPEDRKAPPIDFSSFILSLATTAMVHLGEVPDPAVGKVRENLEAAKQMVDILGILEQKTRGNRTDEENRLLDEILYELRMKFMSKSNVIQT